MKGLSSNKDYLIGGGAYLPDFTVHHLVTLLKIKVCFLWCFVYLIIKHVICKIVDFVLFRSNYQ